MASQKWRFFTERCQRGGAEGSSSLLCKGCAAGSASPAEASLFERFSNACPEPVLVTFRILVVVQWHRNKDVFRTEGWKSTV
jgi:hypothetical protein